VLFVGTKPQAHNSVVEECERVGIPYVTTRWLGGTLTNWSTIRKRIDTLLGLEARRDRGEFEVLIKKEALGLEKLIAKLNLRLGGIKAMRDLPELLFVIDICREETAVREANILGIPIIGMVDTNCDPDPIDLIVPSNDDAIRAIKLSSRLDDRIGEAAGFGLVGAFAVHLGKLGPAFEFLGAAQTRAVEAGFPEGAVDSFQKMGEEVPDQSYGVTLLQTVVGLRAEQQDLRGQVKTLSDISRLQAGLGRNEEAWASYQGAVTVAGQYIAQLQANRDLEDIRGSFTMVLKSLVNTRTELPFLARYLKINRMLPLLNPSWIEE